MVVGSTEAVNAIGNIDVAGAGQSTTSKARRWFPTEPRYFKSALLPSSIPSNTINSGAFRRMKPVWTGTRVSGGQDHKPSGSVYEGDSFGDGASSVGISTATSVDYLAYGSYIDATDGLRRASGHSNSGSLH